MNMNKYLYMFKNTFKTGGDFFSDFLNSNANIKTIPTVWPTVIFIHTLI